MMRVAGFRAASRVALLFVISCLPRLGGGKRNSFFCCLLSWVACNLCGDSALKECFVKQKKINYSDRFGACRLTP